MKIVEQSSHNPDTVLVESQAITQAPMKLRPERAKRVRAAATNAGRSNW
jgi:hypothetical protein